MPDCRAYELVSANDTGGYDVESYLVPGQEPFPGFPAAGDRLLYATHAGAVPGPWNATNKGRDPYLATRTDDGWVTHYEGLPADLNPDSGSFSSELGEADSAPRHLRLRRPEPLQPLLRTAAWQPGIPVRLPNGQLVQGMAGSLDPGDRLRQTGRQGRQVLLRRRQAPDLRLEIRLRAGRQHRRQDLTVYERDLAAGTTQIVSTTQNGDGRSPAPASPSSTSPPTARGSIVGKRVSADSAGQRIRPPLHAPRRPPQQASTSPRAPPPASSTPG